MRRALMFVMSPFKWVATDDVGKVIGGNEHSSMMTQWASSVLRWLCLIIVSFRSFRCGEQSLHRESGAVSLHCFLTAGTKGENTVVGPEPTGYFVQLHENKLTAAILGWEKMKRKYIDACTIQENSKKKKTRARKRLCQQFRWFVAYEILKQ